MMAKSPDGAATDNQPPVAEGILNPFHDAAQFAHLFPGNAGTLNGQINDLRDGKKTDGDGNQADTIPEKHLAEGKALYTRHLAEPDGGKKKTDPAGRSSLSENPRRSARRQR